MAPEPVGEVADDVSAAVAARYARARGERNWGRMDSTAPHPDAKPWPDDHRLTPFQAAVIAVVEALEPGDLVTFNDIADEIGRPGSAQAVANVLRGAPDLPWWRVLPGDGRVYRNLARVQIPLLRADGHVVDADRNVKVPADPGAPTSTPTTRRAERG